ncbi:hypothetical protein ACTFIU_001836 [Dictyostelium citrinum]
MCREILENNDNNENNNNHNNFNNNNNNNRNQRQITDSYSEVRKRDILEYLEFVRLNNNYTYQEIYERINDYRTVLFEKVCAIQDEFNIFTDNFPNDLLSKFKECLTEFMEINEIHYYMVEEILRVKSYSILTLKEYCYVDGFESNEITVEELGGSIVVEGTVKVQQVESSSNSMIVFTSF